MISTAIAMESKPAYPSRDLLFIFMCCPLLIAGCISSHFLAFDDIYHVSDPIVRCQKPWYLAFFPEMTETFFPLSILSYRTEYFIIERTLGVFNWAPFARFDNLLIHAAAGACLWQFFRAAGLSRFANIFATGSFLLHPMAGESVCWVSERKNVLTALFGFAALAVLATHHQRVWRFPAAGILYFMAVLSKPAALGFMPVLFLFEIWMLWREYRTSSNSIKAMQGKFAGAAVGSLLILFVTWLGIHVNVNRAGPLLLTPPGGSVYTGLLTDAEILTRYIQHLLLPGNLSFFYYVKPILSPADPRFLLNLAAIMAIVAGTVVLSSCRHMSIFLWLWFFGALGPVLNIIAFSFVMQDRYVYYSSAAFFAVVALAVEGIATKIKSTEKQRVSIAYGAVLIYAATSFFRSGLWDNTMDLFADAAVKQPQSVFAQYHYGVTLAKAADWTEAHAPDSQTKDRANQFRHEAQIHLQTACDLDDFSRLIDPAHPVWMLAYVHWKQGHLDDAEKFARIAAADNFHVHSTPRTLIDAHVGLGEILLEQRRPEESLEQADAAIKIAELQHLGDAPNAWNLKGTALEALKKPADAAAAYEKVPGGSSFYVGAQQRLREIRATLTIGSGTH